MLTETEMSINGKILILVTETETKKNEMEKFETETDKFGYVCLVSVVFGIVLHMSFGE